MGSYMGVNKINCFSTNLKTLSEKAEAHKNFKRFKQVDRILISRKIQGG